jgi:nitroreductase
VLERRGEWDRPPEFRGFLIGLTSITWREAWKYGMRAFRYCQHDCGHAVAALSYAASALGWRSTLLAAPSDAEVAALLGLDRDTASVEAEAPDCLLWISAGQPLPAELPSAPSRWYGKANRLSSEHVEWADIEQAHRLAAKPRLDHEPANRTDAAHQTAGEPARDLPAAQIFRQRRSAVAFDGSTSIGADALFTMLDATLPRSGTPPWCAWPWAAEVHAAILIHRVDGLDPGLYLLVRNPAALAPLKASLRPDWLWHKVGPPELPLYLLIPHDLRDSARLVCCHQDIAADSCYALGMLAHFDTAASEPWRYRTLYWECGMLGQVLYLEAEAAGIRATGIGCFFDDEMHALLGLQGHAWQSLYHFTAGGAVDDARLTTLPAYHFIRPQANTKA